MKFARAGTSSSARPSATHPLARACRRRGRRRRRTAAAGGPESDSRGVTPTTPGEDAARTSCHAHNTRPHLTRASWHSRGTGHRRRHSAPVPLDRPSRLADVGQGNLSGALSWPGIVPLFRHRFFVCLFTACSRASGRLRLSCGRLPCVASGLSTWILRITRLPDRLRYHTYIQTTQFRRTFNSFSTFTNTNTPNTTHSSPPHRSP